MSNISRWHWMNQAEEGGWFTQGMLEISSGCGKSTKEPSGSPASGEGGCKVRVTNQKELDGFDNADKREKQFGISGNLFRRPAGMKHAFEPRQRRQCPRPSWRAWGPLLHPHPIKPDPQVTPSMSAAAGIRMALPRETCCQPWCVLLCYPHASP